MMSALNALFETQVSSVTYIFRDNAFRLDAGTYSPDTISMQLLWGRNLKSKKLSDIANVFGFARVIHHRLQLANVAGKIICFKKNKKLRRGCRLLPAHFKRSTLQKMIQR